jgi:predicted NAD/FAD-dependent oxidoreductase
MDKGNVAIIGAGMAGLTAARVLTEAGARVTLFDKGRRPGGRLATRHVDGFTFNHGCQFFTARDPGFAAAVAPFSAPWRLAGEDRFAGVPDMAAIATGLAEGLDIRSSAHVRRLSRENGAWHLHFDDREVGSFDRLILAIPAPQAAAMLDEISHPFAANLDTVRIAPCWALLLGFDRQGDQLANAKYRPGSLALAKGASPELPIAWMARENARPGAPDSPGSYTIHASAGWSTAHLEDSAESVIAALSAAFEPARHAVYRAAHRWRYAMADKPLGEPFLWDAAQNLGLCGDWCLAGRLEAAYLSGRALGIRLGT